MSHLLTVPRILSLLAAALVGALAIRPRPRPERRPEPWRPEIDKLRAEISTHRAACNAALSELRNGRADAPGALVSAPWREEMAAFDAGVSSRLQELAGRLGSCEDKVSGLATRVGDHEGKLRSVSEVTAALEQLLAARTAAFDERLAALQASVARTEDRLAHVLDKIQSLPPRLAGRPEESYLLPIENDEAALAQIRQLHV